MNILDFLLHATNILVEKNWCVDFSVWHGAAVIPFNISFQETCRHIQKLLCLFVAPIYWFGQYAVSLNDDSGNFKITIEMLMLDI